MEGSLENDIQAILFDLDGTLLDTSDDLAYILNTMLEEDKRKPVPESVIRNHISIGSRGLIALGFGHDLDTDKAEDLRQQLLTRYNDHIIHPERGTKAHLFAEMETLLAAIESRHIPWGIVTNKPRNLTVPLLEQLKLDERCSVLVCPEDVSVSKPAPESLWLASEKLACDPEFCLYVGDHERDIVAGRAAGMTTVTALYGFIPPEDHPENWHADFDADSPCSILDWLDDRDWSLGTE
ncbi:HAD-IA family hydrolase [Sansalvadorimonas sp. 2012CJ34-2]|uniref:HAD-IA family hydrolase n=1 Tax=Parendozoicomonas callyspongiae TaxID=2942213 RepID=A0ABT0PIV0_9GAMM|nr:HAD-IA family hydrolase [Sansalvadorimonas sp. 2012CJ34-2]MCL6271314.1 HAD-IA family hydrolase [Sansalvadorimonas sp. 2012CJ34-2]